MLNIKQAFFGSIQDLLMQRARLCNSTTSEWWVICRKADLLEDWMMMMLYEESARPLSTDYSFVKPGDLFKSKFQKWKTKRLSIQISIKYFKTFWNRKILFLIPKICFQAQLLEAKYKKSKAWTIYKKCELTRAFLFDGHVFSAMFLQKSDSWLIAV